MSLARTLAITTSAAAVALGGLALAPAANADNGKPVVVNCLGKGVVKPKEIDLSCADGAITVLNITWSSWTMDGARGRGTLAWNTCLPTTCVDGIVEKYPVRISLGRVASAPTPAAFTGMTLRFPNRGPAGAETSTYTLDNAFR
ncbi:MAG: hypothetical protein IPO93_08550 [Actinobacteria bacterium]|jgi:hypothetical protein|nr:hypothetical protein [Actinomycetota bacterium]